MDNLAATLGRIDLATNAPAPFFPNSVAKDFFDLPSKVQTGLVTAIASGVSVRVALVKDEGPFKLKWSEPTVQSLPAVSKAFRQLAEPIITAAAGLEIADNTSLEAMLFAQTAAPSPYEVLPTALFPAYLMRGAKFLAIQYAQATTLDPVPKLDLSKFPALKKLHFVVPDPMVTLTIAAGSLAFLSEAAQVDKVLKISDAMGIVYARDNAIGGERTMVETRDMMARMGGPVNQLTQLSDVVRQLLTHPDVGEHALRSLTEEVYRFRRDNITGVSSTVEILVVFAVLCKPVFKVRCPPLCFPVVLQLNCNRLAVSS